MKLPDVNVWLAASWARHSGHDAARTWMESEEEDLAFCRVSQMAFLRLLTNPAVTREDALSRRRAWEVFDSLMADPRVQYLSEPHGLEALWVAFSKRDDRSHLVWTDDYLAAFAHAADAEFITFDRALSKRYRSIKITTLRS
jgi:toxin-antitoxin system PIN domain toxin